MSECVFVAGRISSRWPTAAPPFPWVLGAESGGVKPRIITVITASVSVLAESDVFLHCKATGNPEPSIAWTKVSTGKEERDLKKEKDRAKERIKAKKKCRRMRQLQGRLMQSMCGFHLAQNLKFSVIIVFLFFLFPSQVPPSQPTPSLVPVLKFLKMELLS